MGQQTSSRRDERESLLPDTRERERDPELIEYDHDGCFPPHGVNEICELFAGRCVGDCEIVSFGKGLLTRWRRPCKSMG